MVWHFKKMFIGLLFFGQSLATKCMSLNNKPCMARPFLINLNPVKFKCYPFIISLDKYSGSCIQL